MSRYDPTLLLTHAAAEPSLGVRMGRKALALISDVVQVGPQPMCVCSHANLVSQVPVFVVTVFMTPSTGACEKRFATLQTHTDWGLTQERVCVWFMDQLRCKSDMTCVVMVDKCM